jgi:hypothetical protein
MESCPEAGSSNDNEVELVEGGGLISARGSDAATVS